MMKITLTITDIDPAELGALLGQIKIPIAAKFDAAGPITVPQVHVTTAPQAAPAPIPAVAQPATAPAAAPPQATAPAAAGREVGSDDGDTALKPDDDVFQRCTTMKDVVQELVRRGIKEETKVVAEILRLKAGGLAVLKPVAEAKIPDRVNVQLVALGVIDA